MQKNISCELSIGINQFEPLYNLEDNKKADLKGNIIEGHNK